MELAFTATDGTRVDLADYRGKVVIKEWSVTITETVIKE
jgi:hypothetical protein